MQKVYENPAADSLAKKMSSEKHHLHPSQLLRPFIRRWLGRHPSDSHEKFGRHSWERGEAGCYRNESGCVCIVFIGVGEDECVLFTGFLRDKTKDFRSDAITLKVCIGRWVCAWVGTVKGDKFDIFVDSQNQAIWRKRMFILSIVTIIFLFLYIRFYVFGWNDKRRSSTKREQAKRRVTTKNTNVTKAYPGTCYGLACWAMSKHPLSRRSTHT